MNEKSEWMKVIYFYNVEGNPAQIFPNPKVKEELKNRVAMDGDTFTFEMRNLSLADTGYYGCDFDVGISEPIITRSVFVKVVGKCSLVLF